MSYINREKVLRLLRVECVAKYPVSFLLGLNAAADEIRKMPTADVVEVRHGEWKKMTVYPMGYNCSECNNVESFESPFCRLCGAKMDGERRTEDAT